MRPSTRAEQTAARAETVIAWIERHGRTDADEPIRLMDYQRAVMGRLYETAARRPARRP